VKRGHAFVVLHVGVEAVLNERFDHSRTVPVRSYVKGCVSLGISALDTRWVALQESVDALTVSQGGGSKNIQ